MNNRLPILIPAFLLSFSISCHNNQQSLTQEDSAREQQFADSLENIRKAEEHEKTRPRVADDIKLEKEFLYDQYTLEDTYPYKDTTRQFQWDKIKEKLAFVVNFQKDKKVYAILQNYKNKNREAPVVKNFVRNAYTRVSDTLGVERYQSAPLYEIDDSSAPTIYGRDGSLVELLSSDTLDMVSIRGISFDGTWQVPKRYVKTIGDTTAFHHVVFVDVTNQNICTVEKKENEQWLIRSMNPATTGLHNPPYGQETPVGTFVIQENKYKMFYYKDGTTDIGGFAPYASRFTNGGYLHGVPVNYPQKSIVEYSATLGTTPRSHMCVRNASSHAKFMYEWASPLQSLVIVID